MKRKQTHDQFMDDPFPEGMMDDIESFLTEIHPTLEPGRSFYPEVFERPHFFPLQRQRELVWMMDEARKYNPLTVYEIGSDKAGGLYHWCQCLPSVRQVIACEIRGTPYRNLFEQAFPHISFLWLDRVSSYTRETVNQVDNWLAGDDIDCLFIDGDKGAFEKDFDTYLPQMAPTSVVFMHDINDRVPTEQYDRVISRGYDGQKYINLNDSIEAGKRERDGEPVTSSHEAWLRHWKGQSCGVGTIYLGGKL